MASDPSRRSFFRGVLTTLLGLGASAPALQDMAAAEVLPEKPGGRLRDRIDRAFREYRRYTGDGLPAEPANAPLPFGAPDSGLYDPSRATLREALGLWSDDIDASVERVVAETAVATSAKGDAVSAAAAAAEVARTLPRGPRAYVKALDPARTGTAWLNEGPRAGMFLWRSGDYAAAIQEDPEEGVYLKAGGVDAGVGAWVRVFDGPVSVRMFGAVGDGKADDTRAFQAAAQFGSVFIPAGTWVIKQPIVLPSKVKVRGAGTEVTVIQSDIVGDSLFKTGADTIFVGLSDMTLRGNRRRGAEGSGHAINFIDPVREGGTFSPQQAILERLRIRDFLGQDVREHGVAERVSSAGVIMHNCLQNICRDVYVSNCGHGFYMSKTQNCRISNCVGAGIRKFALLAYDNENLIVDGCDFVNSGDGVSDFGYPKMQFPWGSGTVISYGNDNFVLRNSKLKNNNSGQALIFSFLSRNDVYDGNWIRPDAVNDAPHKAFYIENSYGVQILNNEFHPAKSKFVKQKYEMIEFHNTQVADTMLVRIVGNMFGDVSGMDINYNIKFSGNRDNRSYIVILEGNEFGFNIKRAAKCIVYSDILLENCALYASRVSNNLHISSGNVTRVACVKAVNCTGHGSTIGPSHFSLNGGVISRPYDGIFPSVLEGALDCNARSFAREAVVAFPIPVAGVSPGDFVQVSYSASHRGLSFFGYVSAADMVTVECRNGTTEAVMMEEGVLRVRVVRQAS